MNNISLALLKSFGLHLLLGGLLVVSMEFHTPIQPMVVTTTQPIQAVAINESQVKEQVKRIQDKNDAQRKAEEKRIRELERRAAEAEKKRKQEQKRVADIEKQKRRKLEEKKKADQAAADARKKQQQEREKARKLEEQRKRKEQERKKAEEKARKAKEEKERQEKARKDAERKRQEEAERVEQERILQEQLNAERAAQAQRRSKYVLSEKDKYVALINNAIKNKLLTDDYMKGKSCKVNIRMATTGFVTSVKVLGGDEAVCRAAKSAVLKAGTLPVSPEPDVYQELKDITFIFDL